MPQLRSGRLTDPALLQPREWLYGRHYLRGAVGCTIATGGTGKSSLLLAEAVAMATGSKLVGIEPAKRQRVLYWNGEEGSVEIQRRLHAVCQQHRINWQDLDGWLSFISGLEHPIKLKPNDQSGLKDVAAFIENEGIDVAQIDPFVSTHSLPEGDNTSIDNIAKQWAAMANAKACAVDLSHHTRKPPTGVVVDAVAQDARGASALIDAVRIARVLNTMSSDDADLAKVDARERGRYFRIDPGKANYAAAAATAWMRIVAVDLPNGDDVGCVVPWKFPGAFDDVTTAHMEEVRRRAGEADYRASPQSAEWIGIMIADVLGADAEADAKRIKALLKGWLKSGALKNQEMLDGQRHNRMFIKPGNFNGAASP
jgi:hypothetical protein